MRIHRLPAALFLALALASPAAKAQETQAQFLSRCARASAFDLARLTGYGNQCRTDPRGPPLDALDACCAVWHRCYTRARCSIGSPAPVDERCMSCDLAVVSCWQRTRQKTPRRYGVPSAPLYPCTGCTGADAGRPRCRACFTR